MKKYETNRNDLKPAIFEGKKCGDNAVEKALLKKVSISFLSRKNKITKDVQSP